MNAAPGDLVLILAGGKKKTLTALSELRLEMGNRLGLRTKDKFVPLWVVDFPLLEWDEESKRFYAMHHPFTSPAPEDLELMESDPGKVRANAYDLVINGVEIGGGSIRIHDASVQKLMFKYLDSATMRQMSNSDFCLMHSNSEPLLTGESRSDLTGGLPCSVDRIQSVIS